MSFDAPLNYAGTMPLDGTGGPIIGAISLGLVVWVIVWATAR